MKNIKISFSRYVPLDYSIITAIFPFMFLYTAVINKYIYIYIYIHIHIHIAVIRQW